MNRMMSELNRNYNLDLIRIIACFMVIMVHVRSFYTYDSSGVMYTFSSFYLTAVRPCVPLFIIISGAVLLPLKDAIRDHLKKRFSKVGIPMGIWMVIYAFLPFPISLYGWSPVYEFSPAADAPLLERAIYNISMIPVTFTGETCHFWFLYIILGLYLFMPIISPWIASATRNHFLYFLTLWGMTLFIPYVQFFGIHQFQGQCDWNLDFSMTYYFAGYLGYLVLGCFLLRYNRLSRKQSCLVGGALFLTGWGLTWLCVYSYGFQKSNVVLLELFIGNLTPNVAMMTAGLFIFFQKMSISEHIHSLLTRLSRLSFGIFLVHWAVAQWAVVYFNQWQISQQLFVPPWLGMPFLAVGVFLVSWLLTELLNLLPIRKWVIG